MEYLIGLVAVLLGGLWFQTKKRQSAEALLSNTQTKEDVQKIQANIDKNNANLSVEEKKREEINAEKDNGPVIDSDILDYFNRKK
jgi:hypothetical protein